MAASARCTPKTINLDETGRRIEQWRETRRHRHAPMPAALWAAAVALAKRHGLYTTVRALRIDYGALKKHLDANGAKRTRPPTFIEIAPAASSAPPCVIEIAGGRRRIRIQVAALDLETISALAQLVGPR